MHNIQTFFWLLILFLCIIIIYKNWEGSHNYRFRFFNLLSLDMTIQFQVVLNNQKIKWFIVGNNFFPGTKLFQYFRKFFFICFTRYRYLHNGKIIIKFSVIVIKFRWKLMIISLLKNKYLKLITNIMFKIVFV